MRASSWIYQAPTTIYLPLHYFLGVGTQSDWRFQDAGLLVDCFSLGGGGVKFGLPKGEGKILLFIMWPDKHAFFSTLRMHAWHKAEVFPRPI